MPNWKPILWHGGGYEANEDGEVRNDRGLTLRPSTNPAGYQYLNLHYLGKKRRFYVHKIIARTFLGDCPKWHEVNHKDGDRKNNRLGNLEYLTRQANLAHGYERRCADGQHPERVGNVRGSRHPQAKLDEAKVKEIRALALTDISTTEIAKRYGVSQPLVAGIVKQRTWKHIL